MTLIELVCWLQIGANMASLHETSMGEILNWLSWFWNPLFSCSV